MLMCLIHDIVEIDAGDTYAYDEEALKTQKVREDAAKERIFSILPEEQKEEFMALFDEFEEFATPESKFAHAMDNLQPLMLNNRTMAETGEGMRSAQSRCTADKIKHVLARRSYMKLRNRLSKKILRREISNADVFC